MRLNDVKEVAAALGLGDRDIEIHGDHRAKVLLRTLDEKPHGQGRYVLVTATTPTPAGEGKTVTAIGLSMGLSKLGRGSCVTLRQSSLGPTLGFKGGGAGGGAARIEPLEEALLGLGSDLFAVESANNLLAALVDDALHRNTVAFDVDSIAWRRVLDVDDRALRRVKVGIGVDGRSTERDTGFDVTAASEVMAILALSRDLADLRRRLANVVVGFDRGGEPVTAETMRAAGAMAVLLRDALRPNLFQTSEGTPALIHAGPFGNIGPGVSSVVADRLALAHSEFVVSEAGFGADIGAEKFFHLKCPVLGKAPDTVVLVTSVRSLKMHSRRFDVRSGHPLPAALELENVDAVQAGLGNLRRHLANLSRFGAPVVVAVNRFATDGAAEVRTIIEAALAEGAAASVEHSAFDRGSEGCIDLAEAVIHACKRAAQVHPLYAPEDPPKEKVRALATMIYGASGVVWEEEAERALARFENAGFGALPPCIAKTHLSLSHDPALLGAPAGFTLPIRGVRLAAGAEYLLMLAGNIVTMPALPADPRAAHLDIDSCGRIVGLA